MDKDPRQIRRMFGAIAGRYDLLNRLLSLSLDRGWRRRAARELGAGPAARVLDRCCGTGDLAAAIRRTGAEVVGADFAHEMLVRCRRKAPGMPLVEADALRLPFADSRFDAVAVAFGLRNLADPAAGLREMLRVLRPGGRLGVLEFSVPRSPSFRALYHVYLGRIVPAVGDRVSGRSGPYRYLAETVRAFPDPQSLARTIRDAGFAAPRFLPLTGGIAALHLAHRPPRPGGPC
jgi:demethylmenaquinone methyltransferase/2-methoxy-6-polyprenyl-1,4-benzoquinol methylase